MKLSSEQVLVFAAGVDRAETLRDGWRLHRLPAAVRALYAADADARARADCTSCVRLRFASDARWIRIRLRYGAPARWYFGGALVVDGERVDAFGPISRQETWEGRVFTQDERVRRVHDIWLPHLCGADVLSLELEEGCAVERAPAPALKWLAYGDSITQGMTASQPVFPWPARTARALNAEVVNYGVGGATLRRELADCMPETNADLITVSYGANDWNTDVPLARFRENAQALVEALRRAFPRTLIVLTTPIPFFRATGPNASGAHLDDFRRVIEETAQGRDGVHAVRGPDLVPADRAYFYDWSHPNDSGMQEIATNLLKKLKPLGLAI